MTVPAGTSTVAGLNAKFLMTIATAPVSDFSPDVSGVVSGVAIAAPLTGEAIESFMLPAIGAASDGISISQVSELRMSGETDIGCCAVRSTWRMPPMGGSEPNVGKAT